METSCWLLVTSVTCGLPTPQRLATYNRDAQIGKGNIANVESVTRDTTGHEVPDAMPDTCRAAQASLHPVFDTRWRWVQNRVGSRKRRTTFSVRRETLFWYSLWARLVTRVRPVFPKGGWSFHTVSTVDRPAPHCNSLQGIAASIAPAA
jgi:hypothetical protein